jgi:hypothetical protein
MPSPLVTIPAGVDLVQDPLTKVQVVEKAMRTKIVGPILNENGNGDLSRAREEPMRGISRARIGTAIRINREGLRDHSFVDQSRLPALV